MPDTPAPRPRFREASALAAGLALLLVLGFTSVRSKSAVYDEPVHFAAGYSSLRYLNSFPLDELKIDSSFVMQLKTPADHSAIIVAIIAMAHSLNLRVVAEGVEYAHQFAFLRSQRCDECQGYLVSKPLPAEDFAEKFLTG